MITEAMQGAAPVAVMAAVGCGVLWRLMRSDAELPTLSADPTPTVGLMPRGALNIPMDRPRADAGGPKLRKGARP